MDWSRRPNKDPDFNFEKDGDDIIVQIPFGKGFETVHVTDGIDVIEPNVGHICGIGHTIKNDNPGREPITIRISVVE